MWANDSNLAKTWLSSLEIFQMNLDEVTSSMSLAKWNNMYPLFSSIGTYAAFRPSLVSLVSCIFAIGILVYYSLTAVTSPAEYALTSFQIFLTGNSWVIIACSAGLVVMTVAGLLQGYPIVPNCLVCEYPLHSLYCRLHPHWGFLNWGTPKTIDFPISTYLND